MPAVSPEFDFCTDDRDWGAVRLLLAELDAEMRERRTALLRRLTAWDIARKIFQNAVTEKMVLRDPCSRDTGYHRSMLAYLRGAGKMLVHEMELHQEVDPTNVGITFEGFSAAVIELEYQEREWYGDMKEQMRETILDQLGLGGDPPSDATGT